MYILEEGTAEKVVLVERVPHAFVAEDARVQYVEVKLAPTESIPTQTRDFIGFPQHCQTNSVFAVHVGHVKSANGSSAPAPQIDLISGPMDLKPKHMIKSEKN